MEILEVYLSMPSQVQSGIGFRCKNCGFVTWFSLPLKSEKIECEHCEAIKKGKKE